MRLTPLSVLALVVIQSSVYANNVLQQAVEKAQPCQSLKYKKGFIKIGVDRFKSFNLLQLDLNIEGDRAHLDAMASLACKISDAAVIREDVSATCQLDGHIDITSCSVNSMSVKIVSHSGSFGGLVKQFAPGIEQKLQKSASTEIIKVCRQLR